MKIENVTIRCRNGLHARVAAQIVEVAQEHKSNVQIRCEGCPRANACSILELLMLGAGQGTQIELVADGVDEKEVLEKLTEVFEDGGGI
jgi:phosphotransferase system HPr (HPr) family protein